MNSTCFPCLYNLRISSMYPMNSYSNCIAKLSPCTEYFSYIHRQTMGTFLHSFILLQSFCLSSIINEEWIGNGQKMSIYMDVHEPLLFCQCQWLPDSLAFSWYNLLLHTTSFRCVCFPFKCSLKVWLSLLWSHEKNRIYATKTLNIDYMTSAHMCSAPDPFVLAWKRSSIRRDCSSVNMDRHSPTCTICLGFGKDDDSNWNSNEFKIPWSNASSLSRSWSSKSWPKKRAIRRIASRENFTKYSYVKKSTLSSPLCWNHGRKKSKKSP